MMPAISIIVPVYNAQGTLCRCLDSILAQTFVDFELLIIDDGSTDGSSAICDRYAGQDNRIRVFHKPNGGVSSARNVGLYNARGKWVTFCDADDYVLPEWIENFGLDNTGEAELIQQGSLCDKTNFRRDGIPSESCGFDYVGETIGYIEALIQAKMIGYTCIKAYLLDIIKKNNLRFNENCKLREDEVFFFQYIISIKNVKSVSLRGYYYFAADWNNKYQLTALERLVWANSMYDSLIYLAKNNDDCLRISWIYNSVIDEYMKAFAEIPQMTIYNKVSKLIRVCYKGCNLFSPLKWAVANDYLRIVSLPALFIHSSLRKLFNK